MLCVHYVLQSCIAALTHPITYSISADELKGYFSTAVGKEVECGVRLMSYELNNQMTIVV